MSDNRFNFEIPFPVDRVTVRRRRLEAPDEEGGEPKQVVETLYDGSYDTGFRAGREYALAEIAAERAVETEEVRQMLRRMNSVLQQLLDTAEGHFPELLVTTLDRLFREHPFTEEEIANEIVALLREVGQAQSIVVEGPASEVGRLEARVEKMGLSLQQGRLQWKGNPNLEKGEYILHTDLGMVDGRRLSKLAQVRMALET